MLHLAFRLGRVWIHGRLEYDENMVSTSTTLVETGWKQRQLTSSKIWGTPAHEADDRTSRLRVGEFGPEHLDHLSNQYITNAPGRDTERLLQLRKELNDRRDGKGKHVRRPARHG